MTRRLRIVLVVSMSIAMSTACDQSMSTAPTLTPSVDPIAPVSSPAAPGRALVIEIEGLRTDALAAARACPSPSLNPRPRLQLA